MCLMTRMCDQSLLASACKKVHIVRMALAKEDAVYVSMIHRIMLTMPALQYILNACLTQASFDLKEKEKK